MKNQDKYIVYLEISSWAGISLGANHYYGKLIGYAPEYVHIEVEKPMTISEARKLSKKDDWEYSAGNMTSRFDTREDVITSAMEVLKDKFPDCKMLLVGNPAYYEPKLCAWCKDSDILEVLNKIWFSYEPHRNSDNWNKRNKFTELFEETIRKYLGIDPAPSERQAGLM